MDTVGVIVVRRQPVVCVLMCQIDSLVSTRPMHRSLFGPVEKKRFVERNCIDHYVLALTIAHLFVPGQVAVHGSHQLHTAMVFGFGSGGGGGAAAGPSHSTPQLEAAEAEVGLTKVQRTSVRALIII